MNGKAINCPVDELAGFRRGDVVRLPCIDSPMVVIGFDPPSMLWLRAPSGRELRAGWRAVTKDDSTAS